MGVVAVPTGATSIIAVIASTVVTLSIFFITALETAGCVLTVVVKGIHRYPWNDNDCHSYPLREGTKSPDSLIEPSRKEEGRPIRLNIRRGLSSKELSTVAPVIAVVGFENT